MFYSLVNCGIISLFFSLSLSLDISTNKYSRCDYTMQCGMVAYQLDFSRRLTVFFEDRTSVWVHLDPRRRCLISAALIARGIDAMRMGPLFEIFSLLLSEKAQVCDRESPTYIMHRVQYFVSLNIISRMIHYARKRD